VSAIGTETLLRQLKWRYATKRLDPAKKIDPLTCPMEGLDPAGYDKALGLEGSGFRTVAACPAGYRAETDKHSALAKVRFEKQEIITYIP
jgi:hypothetical protein